MPVLQGAWIEPGQHIVTVMRSNSTLGEGWVKEGRRESDNETPRRTGVIVTIRRDSVKHERQAGLFAAIGNIVIA
jgi:hypothetical protein